jgi:hypothetical protein
MTSISPRSVNGMTVLTDDMPHLESASLGIWVKAGSRSETAQMEHGMSHVLEHMAFKGTKTRSARQIASNHRECRRRPQRRDLSGAHRLFRPRAEGGRAAGRRHPLRHPAEFEFEQNELDREQQVIVQEIGAARDNPDDHVFDLFQQAAFPDQAIGRTILGTVESVNSFKPDSDPRLHGSQLCRRPDGAVRRRQCRPQRSWSISPMTASTRCAVAAPRRPTRLPMSAASSDWSPTMSRPISCWASKGAPIIPTASTPCRSSPRSLAAA